MGTSCWLAIVAKVSTVDNLRRRRGLTLNNIVDIYVVGRKEVEMVNVNC